MNDLIEDDDKFCCPDGTEPFPDFSVKTLEELDPCGLTITAKELIELTYGAAKGTTTIDIARAAVAAAFMNHFKIKIDG